MVLLSAQGMPVARIAEVSFTSDDRVRDVIHNFNTDGFNSLYPKYKGGRPRTFTLPERREIKKASTAQTGFQIRQVKGLQRGVVGVDADHDTIVRPLRRLRGTHDNDGTRRAWPPASSPIRAAAGGLTTAPMADDHQLGIRGAFDQPGRRVPHDQLNGEAGNLLAGQPLVIIQQLGTRLGRRAALLLVGGGTSGQWQRVCTICRGRLRSAASRAANRTRSS
jgi:transposase